MAGFPEVGQSGLQARLFPIKKITKDVSFPPVESGADFDSRNNFNAEFVSGLNCFRDSFCDVMISNGQGADAGLVSAVHHVSSGETPVGMGGVEMEVDSRHNVSLRLDFSWQRGAL